MNKQIVPEEEPEHTHQVENGQNTKQPLQDVCYSVLLRLRQSLIVTSSIAITAMSLAVQVIPDSQKHKASKIQIAYLAILGFAFYTFVFHLTILTIFKTSFGRRQMQAFHLKKYEAYDICVKSVSAMQALLACVFACLVAVEDCCHRDNNYFAFSRWIEFYTWFGLPYFVYDIAVMYKAYTLEHGHMDILTFIMRNKIIFLHHLYIPTMGLLGVQNIRWKFGDCVFMFLYTMEFSTIFVNIRLIFHRLNMSSSLWYFVNAIAMFISFLVCRILMIPYLIYMYSALFNLTLIEAIKTIPTPSILSMCLFMVLQVYWMGLMIRVAIRLIRQHLGN